MKKRFLISVSNDISTDQRVRKQCDSLVRAGYQVFLIGRRLDSSMELDRPYETHRMKLFFNKGALFYAELNIRLFYTLLWRRTNYLWANDLDTLPANYFLSLFRGKRLIYDSHEFFTEVPEIQGRKFVKSTWKFFEKWMIHRSSIVLTVNKSIAQLFNATYGILEPLVIRNLPIQGDIEYEGIDRESVSGGYKYLIVLQGSGINVDRGGEELVQSMKFLQNVRLLIIGSGDAIGVLKNMVNQFDLTDRVIFYPRMKYEDMMAYTAICDLGLSLDKASNINYQYSLPNKIFDYAKAGIPVLASKLVEIERVFDEYPFGRTIDSHEPENIARSIESILENDSDRQEMKTWTAKATKNLNWNSDFIKLISKLEQFE